jgi:hypothetical protein
MSVFILPRIRNFLPLSLFRYQKPLKYNSSVFVALGGVVVSVLATGPKVRGFKPGRGRWILRVIKSAALLPSEGK